MNEPVIREDYDKYNQLQKLLTKAGDKGIPIMELHQKTKLAYPSIEKAAKLWGYVVQKQIIKRDRRIKVIVKKGGS